ncbi:unnamed protein product [Effrenium voratum]|uniref:Uncharacterized protein n=1 Tax=Effrenium voratum TaxID=2562239 RepID=A0AA36MKS3_9DINO|nr:unnamed protein product [Effrenium voratum]
MSPNIFEEIVDELQPFIREIGYNNDEEALKALQAKLQENNFQSWLKVFYAQGAASWYQCYSYEAGAGKNRHLRQLAHMPVESGNTLLNVLVQKNFPQCARWLLENYSNSAQVDKWLVLADVTWKSGERKRTALHTACMHGHLESLEVLLEHLSKRMDFVKLLEEPNQEQHSCLQLLVDRQFHSCIELVQSHGKLLDMEILMPAPSPRSDLEIHFVEKEEESNETGPIVKLRVAQGQSQLEVLFEYLKAVEPAATRLHIPKIDDPQHMDAGIVDSMFEQFARFQTVDIHGFVHPDVYRFMLDSLFALGKRLVWKPIRLQEVALFVRPVEIEGMESLFKKRIDSIAQQIIALMVVQKTWKVRLTNIHFADPELRRLLHRLKWITEIVMFVTTDAVWSRAAEQTERGELFVDNPFNKGLLQICDIALGRNMKHLRHCSDLASALSEDFWEFVENFLDTWSQLVEAFARQAAVIDCADKRLKLLFQNLDHASAAILHTLLSLDEHLDAGKPEGARKGAQRAMEYLRRLQACEEALACKLFQMRSCISHAWSWNSSTSLNC